MTRKQLTLAITGASGFIGRHTVAEARLQGHRVHAIIRDQAKADPAWWNDPEITISEIDFNSQQAEESLAEIIGNADAVIHCAAALQGSDAHHRINSIHPMEVVLAAIRQSPDKPRLVLVSSLTVYDLNGLSALDILDETTPIVAHPQMRDAYCRSKLALERLALEAAKTSGISLRIMRPGAVFGPDQLWNGHIGLPIGPALIQIGNRGEVPLCFVEHCAQALVLAAEIPITNDQHRDKPSDRRVEIINILDNDLPERARFIHALKQSGWPRYVIPLPWRALTIAASTASMLGASLSARLPGLLRPSILSSRLKPVRYSNARLRKKLGWHSDLSFEDTMRRATAPLNQKELLHAGAN